MAQVEMEVASGGGGIGDLKTTILFEGNTTGDKTVENLNNYKMIMFCMRGSTTGGWEMPCLVPLSYFKTMNSSTRKMLLSFSGSALSIFYVNDTTINVQEIPSSRSVVIYGIG